MNTRVSIYTVKRRSSFNQFGQNFTHPFVKGYKTVNPIGRELAPRGFKAIAGCATGFIGAVGNPVLKHGIYDSTEYGIKASAVRASLPFGQTGSISGFTYLREKYLERKVSKGTTLDRSNFESDDAFDKAQTKANNKHESYKKELEKIQNRYKKRDEDISKRCGALKGHFFTPVGWSLLHGFRHILVRPVEKAMNQYKTSRENGLNKTSAGIVSGIMGVYSYATAVPSFGLHLLKDNLFNRFFHKRA